MEKRREDHDKVRQREMNKEWERKSFSCAKLMIFARLEQMDDCNESYFEFDVFYRLIYQ